MMKKERKRLLVVWCILALLITAVPLSLPGNASASQDGEILTGKGWWYSDRYQSDSGVLSQYYPVDENSTLEFNVDVQKLGERAESPYGAVSAELVGNDESGARCWFTTNSSMTAWTFDEAGVSMENVGGSADADSGAVDHYDSEGRSNLREGAVYRITVTRTDNDYVVKYYDMDADAVLCTLTLTDYRALEDVQVCIIAQEGVYKVSCSAENDSTGGETADKTLPSPKYVYNFDSTIGDAVVVNRQNENEDGKTPTGEMPQPDTSASEKYADGKNGKALYLDGSYGLKLPVANLGKSFTISFWVKTEEEMDDFTPILFAGRDYLGEQDLHWLSITKATWYYESDYEELELGGSPVVWSRILTEQEEYWPWYSAGYDGRQYEVTPDKGWRYITLSVNAEDGAMYYPQNYNGHHGYTYIDGKLYGNGCVAKDIYDGLVDTFLGINPWDKKFKGYIDDLAFYSEYVTKEQAAKMYENAIGGTGNIPPSGDKDPVPAESAKPTAIPDVTAEPTTVPDATAEPTPAPDQPSSPAADNDDTDDNNADDDDDDMDDDDFDEPADEQSLTLKKGETCRVSGGEQMALCDSIDMVIPGAKGPASYNILGLSDKWNIGRINQSCSGSYDYSMIMKKKSVVYYVTCTKSKMKVFVQGKSVKIKKVKSNCLKKYTLKPGKKMSISAKTSKGVMFFISGKGAKIKVKTGKKSSMVKNNRVITKKGKKTKITLHNISKKKITVLVPGYTYKSKVTGSKN